MNDSNIRLCVLSFMFDLSIIWQSKALMRTSKSAKVAISESVTGARQINEAD